MKLSVAVVCTILLVAAVVASQENIDGCKTNSNSPPAGVLAWSPDTEVKVHFSRNTFTPEQRAALRMAMDLWTKTVPRTAAGVTFTYAGEIDGAPDCKNCLLVTRQRVRKYYKYFAFFNPLRQSEDGQLISAWIVFDDATVNPQALQLFMTHELGHGLGLADCPSCKKKHTIMRSFPGINKVDGVIEPSVCDLEVVRQVYELRRRVASSGGFDGARN